MNSNESGRMKKGLKSNSVITYHTGIYASFLLQVLSDAKSVI